MTDSILSSITTICRRLDGIALAIELAAARTSALPPTTIAAQLAERLLSITGGSRDPLPRHKTMQALFDWSYDLLDQTERSIFRKLSMFVGGFTLELATSLCADELGEAGVVGVLGSLVDKSLVQSDSYAEPTRYRLLEPVRQYAREKLRAYDEEDRAARNHAVALLELAERFDSRPNPPTDRDVQAHIEPERENFRAAFAWALGAIGDVAIGQRLAASGSATWVGHLTGESPRWIASALEACDESTQPRMRAKLLLRATRSTLQFGTGDKQLALEAAERALQHQLPDDVAGIAQAQFYVGWALSYWGRFDEAEKLIREALEKARSCGHQGLVADALVNLYRIRWLAGDFEEARKSNREAHALHLASGRDSLATVADDHLGEIEFALGNTEAALRLSQQVAETYRARGDLARLSAALCNAAAYSIALDRFEDGRRYASEALALARQTATRRLLAWAMQHLAAAAILRADLQTTSAIRLLGFVDQVVLQLVSSRPPTEQREYDRVLSALHGGFAEDELAKLTASGQDLSEAQAIEIAVRLSAEAPEGPS
ncbi:MAG: hypothetical protein JO349_08135 [Candidatus Eremiobacteraeota bacterium]|nr:hypothetical protein [Candidatus Eremiobacteraeota bacterium]